MVSESRNGCVEDVSVVRRMRDRSLTVVAQAQDSEECGVLPPRCESNGSEAADSVACLQRMEPRATPRVTALRSVSSKAL